METTTNTATFVWTFKRFYINSEGTPIAVMQMHFEGKDYEEKHVKMGDEYTCNFNYAIGRGQA